MEKLLTNRTNKLRASSWTNVSLLAICLVLGFAFWILTTPIAIGREMSPAEIVESQLPDPKTLAKATKAEVLSAVCAAVKRFKKDAPQIVEAAITARKEFAIEMVENAIHCLGKADCGLIQNIVSAAITAHPDAASEIADAALGVTPNCADSIQQAGIRPPGEGPNEANDPTNQNPPPGSVSGGVDPQEANILVCDNGTQVNIAASQVESYLRAHQGAFVGNCQLTPITNP